MISKSRGQEREIENHSSKTLSQAKSEVKNSIQGLPRGDQVLHEQEAGIGVQMGMETGYSGMGCSNTRGSEPLCQHLSLRDFKTKLIF